MNSKIIIAFFCLCLICLSAFAQKLDTINNGSHLIMPRFPGCENLKDVKSKEQCAQEKMMDFIYDNLNYPMIARENGIQGKVVIRFQIDTFGIVNNAKIIKGHGVNKCPKLRPQKLI